MVEYLRTQKRSKAEEIQVVKNKENLPFEKNRNARRIVKNNVFLKNLLLDNFEFIVRFFLLIMIQI